MFWAGLGLIDKLVRQVMRLDRNVTDPIQAAAGGRFEYPDRTVCPLKEIPDRDLLERQLVTVVCAHS